MKRVLLWLLCGIVGAGFGMQARSQGVIALESGAANMLPACAPGALRYSQRSQPAAQHAAAAKRSLHLAVWGDSHTAGGHLLDSMLAAAGVRLADTRASVLPGAFAASDGVRYPLRAFCSQGWRPLAPDRSAGLAGVPWAMMFSEVQGSSLALDFAWPHEAVRLDAVTLHYGKDDARRTLVVGLRANGGAEQLLSLDNSGVIRITASERIQTLALRLVAGQITLQAFELHHPPEDSHLIFDVFSWPGVGLRSWLNIARREEPAPFLTASPPDTVLVQYGTNDALASDVYSDYPSQLRRTLAAMRSRFPKAACILVGPPDRGGVLGPQREPGGRVHQWIARQQAAAAASYGCKFWDWQADMGGPGSAARWAREAPPRMQADLIHLTTQGYRDSGARLGRAVAGGLK